MVAACASPRFALADDPGKPFVYQLTGDTAPLSDNSPGKKLAFTIRIAEEGLLAPPRLAAIRHGIHATNSIDAKKAFHKP